MLDGNLQKSLCLATNSTAVNDATYKKLLENVFVVLTGCSEVHSKI